MGRRRKIKYDEDTIGLELETMRGERRQAGVVGPMPGVNTVIAIPAGQRVHMERHPDRPDEADFLHIGKDAWDLARRLGATAYVRYLPADRLLYLVGAYDIERGAVHAGLNGRNVLVNRWHRTDGVTAFDMPSPVTWLTASDYSRITAARKQSEQQPGLF